MPLGKWTSEGQVKEKSSSCGREPTLKGRKCVGIFGEWRKDCVNVFFQTRWYRRKFSLPLKESFMLSARAGFLFSLSCLSLKSQNEQEAMRMAMNIRMWTEGEHSRP